MTREQRQQLLEENLARQAELQRDIAAREQRQAAGIEPIYDVVRRSPPPMVYKTNPNALLVQPQPTQPTRQVVLAMIEDAVGVIGEFVAEEQNKQDAALMKKMNQLRDEINALRSELEVLRATNVTPLRGRDHVA